MLLGHPPKELSSLSTSWNKEVIETFPGQDWSGRKGAVVDDQFVLELASDLAGRPAVGGQPRVFPKVNTAWCSRKGKEGMPSGGGPDYCGQQKPIAAFITC